MSKKMQFRSIISYSTCCTNWGGYGDHRLRGESDYSGGYRALSPARARFSFRVRDRHHRPEPPRVSPPSQARTRYCACALAHRVRADRRGNRESGQGGQVLWREAGLIRESANGSKAPFLLPADHFRSTPIIGRTQRRPTGRKSAKERTRSRGRGRRRGRAITSAAVTI